MNHYKLHKGLIVDVGEHSFELMADVEVVSQSDSQDIIDQACEYPVTMHERMHISEMNKLSSVISDYDLVAGGDLPNIASAEKIQ